MKRILSLLAICLTSLGLAPLTACAEEGSRAEFAEGEHYQRTASSRTVTEDGDQVEVVEVFWYGCPHCYDFEPYIDEWRQDKPEDAEFVLLPAALNPQWRTHSRAFFAFKRMGEVENLHSKLFQAIHAQGRRLNSPDSIARFAGRFGVDEEEFREVYHSKEVNADMERASEIARGWGIRGVPTVVVDGQYQVSASMAGGYDRMIEVIDYLVEKEAAE